MNNKKDNLIYGRNPIKEALRANRVKSIYLATGFTNNEILSMIDEAGVRVNYISNKELDNMSRVKKLLLPFCSVFNMRTFFDVRRILKKEKPEQS